MKAKSLFLKHLPNKFSEHFEKTIHANLAKEYTSKISDSYCCDLWISKCLQTRSYSILGLKIETDDICEWRDCKTLYKKSGYIPDLQHVSRIDLKMSPDIFQNNLKDFLNNNHPEKILHVDMHDWKNKQTIIDSELWNDFVKFTHECDTSNSEVYLEILNKPLETFKNNPFIKSYVLDKLKSIDYSKFKWVGYYHFTEEQKITYVEFPNLIVHSQLKLSNYQY